MSFVSINHSTYRSHGMQLHDTVTWNSHMVQSHGTVPWHIPMMQSHGTVTRSGHMLQSGGPFTAKQVLLSNNLCQNFVPRFIKKRFHDYKIILSEFVKVWRCRGSNPGPFTCKANALPLSYIPRYPYLVKYAN